MNRLIILIFAILLISNVSFAGQPYVDPIDGKVKSLPDNAKFKSAIMGTPNATEGVTVTDLVRMVVDNNGNRVIWYAETSTLTDGTEGTVDVVRRKWGISGGVVGMLFSDAAYSAAPSGYETPIRGCQVWSNGGGIGVWGTVQWVYYNGSDWVAD